MNESSHELYLKDCEAYLESLRRQNESWKRQRKEAKESIHVPILEDRSLSAWQSVKVDRMSKVR